MKNKYKYKYKYLIISIAIVMMISIPVSKVVLDGYFEYKQAINNMSIDKKIEEIRNNENYVRFENIDKDFVNAIISVEDHRFYEHNGLDFISIARATIKNIQAGKIVQGGSTITQQLAKNLYLNGDREFSRKVSEVFLVNDLEKKYSKNEIFEIYANIINYGNGYTGIKEASEGYFGEESDDLNLQQATMLAGLSQSPKRYNPTKYYDKAVARQKDVIAAMQKYGDIDYKEDYYILAERDFNLA